ncbi:MAG: calcium-translocating P-type ATPase, PMCA-type [Muribaculaceae bacterium]|nr:calcium-translocating P-type ATPase, PMCA-type [Muribaculaceae bacterium]
MVDTNNIKGLTAEQVIESRRLHGENILTPPPRESLLSKFIKKFNDPLIIILMIAGALSVGISCYEFWGLDKSATVFFEPVGIFIAIILATGLSFYFEAKADREFAILNQVNDDEPVRVIRDGNNIEISKREVVVGDIVFINQGDEVPADGKLIEAVALTVDESTLTGEPSCNKSVNPADYDANATYATNEVLRGTKVMDGHGIFCAERVGDATENGKVYVEAQIDDNTQTPLNEQFERLSSLISKVSYLFAALIIIGRCTMFFATTDYSLLSVDFGTYLLQSFMVAVTLIVVTVPEGLPMAVTLSLAFSMRRMLRTNNLVRKLHACETMGATTVICTDKTGTLTQNQMRVASADFAGPINEIAEGIAVNSTATLDLSGDKPKALGNPTEGALLLWLRENGFDYMKLRAEATRLEELPFSTERKYMATVVDSQATGRRTLYVKGAPEIVLGLCSTIAGEKTREQIAADLTVYQSQAMRTLGFAAMVLPDDIEPASLIVDGAVKADELEFLGMVAISDPVRADVPGAVRECLDAGISVKIVTGDTPLTAKEIGRQIGLWDVDDTDKQIITGPEFAALSDEQLYERVNDLKIISRARPSDKKRLVETLQRHNQVVAVTGDGTNDAPALKAANVGLSMGDGTSVAKEASDITIIDNSFTSIGRAVMWGRSLYRNIQRFILFQMTINVVASLIVLVGSFIGTESPLTVTQMLWVNLIMDTFAAMALASLPPSAAVMKEKPRSRDSFIINSGMWKSIFTTGGIFFALLLAILYVMESANITSMSDLLSPNFGSGKGLTVYEQSLFFTIFVFLQFWNIFNARAFATGRSALHLKHCSEFILIATLIVVGQLLIVTFGGGFFTVAPLSLPDWLIIIGSTSLVLWIGELQRLFSKI